MGIGCPRQREGAVQHRLQAAATLETVEPVFPEAPDHRVLLRLAAGFHHRADDPQVTVENVLQFHRHLPAAAQYPDLDQPSAVGQRLEIAGEIRLADEIDDHIHTPPLGVPGDGFGEVLALVVDDDLRPQVLDPLDLAAIGGRIDRGARGTGQLHRGGPHATGGSMHQHRVAPLQPRQVQQGFMGGDEHLGNRRRMNVIQ